MRLKESILPLLGAVTVSLILVLAFLVNNYFAQTTTTTNRGLTTSYTEQDQTKYTKLVATQAVSPVDQIQSSSQNSSISSPVSSTNSSSTNSLSSSSQKSVEVVASLSNPKPIILSSSSAYAVQTSNQSNTKDNLVNSQVPTPIKVEPLSAPVLVKETPKPVLAPTTQTLPKELPIQAPKPTVELGIPSSISIPSINIKDQRYAFSSLFSIDDLYQKMIYKPVMENQVAGEVCKPNSHSYIFGHSEPSSPSEVGPGTSVFANLNLLINGDIVNAVDSQGNKCQYKITGREVITTDGADKISYAKYQQLFFPDLSQGSVLTLQTCQKGSSTVRIVFRAVMI
jgi:Sortase domain